MISFSFFQTSQSLDLDKWSFPQFTHCAGFDCLFEIRKIAVCFLWLSLPGDYRVTFMISFSFFQTSQSLDLDKWSFPQFTHCAGFDCLFEIRKIAVCFLWLSLPGDYRVTDEALLAETT